MTQAVVKSVGLSRDDERAAFLAIIEAWQRLYEDAHVETVTLRATLEGRLARMEAKLSLPLETPDVPPLGLTAVQAVSQAFDASGGPFHTKTLEHLTHFSRSSVLLALGTLVKQGRVERQGRRWGLVTLRPDGAIYQDGSSRAQVLTVLASGAPVNTGTVLAFAQDFSHAAVMKMLATLKAEGVVLNPSRGVWQLRQEDNDDSVDVDSSVVPFLRTG